MNIFDTINRLGKQEDKITEKIIVSPVFHNKKIVVQIENLAQLLNIPLTEPGWYKFKPLNNRQAAQIGKASLCDRQNYLKRLKKIRVIMAIKKGQVYYSIPIKGNALNLSPNKLQPVLLPDNMVEDFTRCLCRFDGENIWYEQVDMSASLSKSDYLTNALKNFTNPKNIKYKDLTIEEKTAYTIRYGIEKTERIKKNKNSIQMDVEHAGGNFISSKEKTDHLSVTYSVDGSTYTSYVSKGGGHKIITAGICLTDDNDRQGDSDFDLKSIISVIREGQDKNLIYRTRHE